jgi:hypothetical protein
MYLRHYHIEFREFTGGWEEYTSPNGQITLSIYEDDDQLDRFYAKVNGVDKGRIKTLGEFEQLIKDHG